MRLRHVVGVVLCLLSVAAIAPPDWAHGANPKRAEEASGWPATRAGAMGQRWVTAFSTSEAAMREFNRKSLSAASLASKGLEARTETYRNLRERFGTLALASIVKSEPFVLAVRLIDADAKTHEFTFTVESKPPHGLVSVTMKEIRHGHGGGGH
jgi:hypothetical protein